MPNYQHGKIYSIRSRSRLDLVYIGSTTRPLSERFGEHKLRTNNCKSKQIIELGDAYIELIETHACSNVEELRKREGHFQRTMDCVNRCIAGRKPSERYQDNKEAILADKKQYYQDNKEDKALYNKQYNQENKEVLATYKKQYYHDNKEDIAAHKKQYDQENKYSIHCIHFILI